MTFEEINTIKTIPPTKTIDDTTKLFGRINSGAGEGVRKPCITKNTIKKTVKATADDLVFGNCTASKITNKQET